MTEAEFLADLQTKVLKMGTPTTLNGAETVDGVLPKKVVIVEMGLKGTAKPPRTYQYTVINPGVEGDPNPFLNEQAYPVNPIELPVGDALNAVGYLEAQKAAGSWVAYEYLEGRSDLGHFFAKVWVSNGDGTESEKRMKVSYDAEGNPSHAEIV